jgi:hypothetical protein
MPGDVQDVLLILVREYLEHKQSRVAVTLEALAEWLAARPKTPHGLQCSMFAIWGSRTQDGTLFSARNLGECTFSPSV